MSVGLSVGPSVRRSVGPLVRWSIHTELAFRSVLLRSLLRLPSHTAGVMYMALFYFHATFDTMYTPYTPLYHIISSNIRPTVDILSFEYLARIKLVCKSFQQLKYNVTHRNVNFYVLSKSSKWTSYENRDLFKMRSLEYFL